MAPPKRKPENRGLPACWVKKHGAYYYLVPETQRAAWDGNVVTALGVTVRDNFNRTRCIRVCLHPAHEMRGSAASASDLIDNPAPAAAAPSVPAGWVPVSERLPEPYTVVALLNVDDWMNTGKDDFHCNRSGTGWLCDWTNPGYWSVIGERRAICMNGYTHWMPLPAAPTAGEKE